MISTSTVGMLERVPETERECVNNVEIDRIKEIINTLVAHIEL
jgi:hypothetical protein